MKNRLLIPIAIMICAGVAAGQTQRYTIVPKNFTHVEGFAYLLGIDLGEDGYKEGNKKSHLRLFEDGKELGPIDHYHRNIIDKGEGRYSHWSRASLYMSASDNSDPRSNGRKYEIASDAFDSVPGSALACLRLSLKPSRLAGSR